MMRVKIKRWPSQVKQACAEAKLYCEVDNFSIARLALMDQKVDTVLVGMKTDPEIERVY